MSATVLFIVDGFVIPPATELCAQYPEFIRRTISTPHSSIFVRHELFYLAIMFMTFYEPVNIDSKVKASAANNKNRKSFIAKAFSLFK